jgi:hypothetical protein
VRSEERGGEGMRRGSVRGEREEEEGERCKL